MRELDRLKMIQAVVDMGLKPGRAAERLGLTVRQVERLMARYRESGAAGLASRKRDTPGNHHPHPDSKPTPTPTSVFSRNPDISIWLSHLV